MRRNVDKVSEHAIVIDARARVHDAMLADVRARVNERTGHHDRPRADFCAWRNNRRRVDRRCKIYVPAALQKRDDTPARLVVADAYDCRSCGNVVAANNGHSAKLARRDKIVADAINNRAPASAQDVENHFGVSAGSVEKKDLRRCFFQALRMTLTTRARSSSESDDPDGRQSPREKIFSEVPFP